MSYARDIDKGPTCLNALDRSRVTSLRYSRTIATAM